LHDGNTIIIREISEIMIIRPMAGFSDVFFIDFILPLFSLFIIFINGV
jgi:hypothetical protein